MFKPQSELAIYEYHNGKKVIKADPVAIYIALKTWKESNFEDDMKLATVDLGPVQEDKVDMAQLEALDRIAQNVRQAFPEVRHLSIADCFMLLTDYMGWTDKVKKKPVRLPKSLPPARKPCRKEPAMKPSSDCTSTAK